MKIDKLLKYFGYITIIMSEPYSYEYKHSKIYKYYRLNKINFDSAPFPYQINDRLLPKWESCKIWIEDEYNRLKRYLKDQIIKDKLYETDKGEFKTRDEILKEAELDQIKNWDKGWGKSYKCIKNKDLFKSRRLAKKCYDYCIANCSYFCDVLSGPSRRILFKMTFNEWYNRICWHPFEDKFKDYLK